MMNIITYLTEPNQLKSKTTREFIIEPAELSRFGKLSIEQVNNLAQEAKALGKTLFLEWDILMVETEFKKAVDSIGKIDLNQFQAIRVQDAGALEWVLKNTNLKIHLNLETGNHNLEGIKKWMSYCGDRLERIVLNIEWSKKQLEDLLPELNIPVEFLGMGRILLFYTPRNLLKPGMKNPAASHWIEANGQSEESPHKGFPLLENSHGTYMFLPSDHCLLDQWDSLKELNIDHIRIDNRFMNEDLFTSVIGYIESPSEEKFENIRETSPNRLIRGFFNTNKSDVLFKKLKNYRIQRVDENYLGQVLEVNKKNYLALKLKNPSRRLRVGDQLGLKTPDGKLKHLTVDWIKDCRGIEKSSAGDEDLVFVNHVGGVSVRAAVYFTNG